MKSTLNSIDHTSLKEFLNGKKLTYQKRCEAIETYLIIQPAAPKSQRPSQEKADSSGEDEDPAGESSAHPEYPESEAGSSSLSSYAIMLHPNSFTDSCVGDITVDSTGMIESTYLCSGVCCMKMLSSEDAEDELEQELCEACSNILW